MKTTTLLLLGLLALAACGDNLARPDARKPPDGPPADAQCSNCPAAPALGTQIDRMGRPAVNTALNNFANPTVATATAAKDAYNASSDPSGWATTMLNGVAALAEFQANLAIVDALDTGICGNGICEAGEWGSGATGGVCPLPSCSVCAADCTTNQIGALPTNGKGGGGCGNQAEYNGSSFGGGAPAADSYVTLGGILVDDELYMDTTKTTCDFYLAVEFGVVTGQGNSTCGGRAPEYDVIDFSFSMLAMGIRGFSVDGLFTPQFQDGAGPHTDYTSTFPFLGEPH